MRCKVIRRNTGANPDSTIDGWIAVRLPLPLRGRFGIGYSICRAGEVRE